MVSDDDRGDPGPTVSLLQAWLVAKKLREDALRELDAALARFERTYRLAPEKVPILRNSLLAAADETKTKEMHRLVGTGGRPTLEELDSGGTPSWRSIYHPTETPASSQDPQPRADPFPQLPEWLRNWGASGRDIAAMFDTLKHEPHSDWLNATWAGLTRAARNRARRRLPRNLARAHRPEFRHAELVDRLASILCSAIGRSRFPISREYDGWRLTGGPAFKALMATLRYACFSGQAPAPETVVSRLKLSRKKRLRETEQIRTQTIYVSSSDAENLEDLMAAVRRWLPGWLRRNRPRD